MKFGLEVQVIENIISVLEQHPKVDKAFVFDSRAKGNYRPDSDIDIAIKGNGITTDDIIAISVAIETIGITHKFDLIDYNSIKEPALKEHIDRVGIEFYSKWKEIALGDVIDVKHGYAFNGKHIVETPTNNILVTPGNFHIGGGFKSSKYKYYNSEFPSDYILKPNDIVVTMTDLSQETDTLGYSAKIPKQDGINYLHNQRIGLVQFKSNDVDKNFIYWVLRTKEYQGFIVGSASGTSIMHTAPTRIKEYSFLLPPIQEQNAISSILSSLDDKIDLLHRQNKTLEQLAETLFRQWFVEEAEESWEYEKLKKYVTTVDNRGKTPPVYDIQTEFPLIEANAINGDERLINYSVIKKYVTEDTYANWFRNKLSKYDTIITTVGANIGAMAMFVIEKGNIAQNLIGLSANGISPFYLYQMLKFKEDEILQMDIGGVQPSLKVPHLLSIEIPIPPIELQNEFDTHVLEFVSKMEINYNQIRTLTQTRDTLLPKLMSGEVRVEM